jgi:acylphosphatase
MDKQANIIVTGLVQGVNFRYDTKRKAEQLNITGYIKNLPTGNQVEIVAKGDKEAISELIEWCKSGTVYSRIENVESVWKDSSGEYNEFKIEY